MAEADRTRRVDADRHRVYLQRADELMVSVADAEGRRHAVASGVAAAQAAIAVSDAVTVARLGLRSVGPDHEAAVGLLGRCGAMGAEEHAKQLKQALAVKSLLEYDDRLPTAREARDVVARTKRLYAWARALVEP